MLTQMHHTMEDELTAWSLHPYHHWLLFSCNKINNSEWWQIQYTVNNDKIYWMIKCNDSCQCCCFQKESSENSITNVYELWWQHISNIRSKKPLSTSFWDPKWRVLCHACHLLMQLCESYSLVYWISLSMETIRFWWGFYWYWMIEKEFQSLVLVSFISDSKQTCNVPVWKKICLPLIQSIKGITRASYASSSFSNMALLVQTLSYINLTRFPYTPQGMNEVFTTKFLEILSCN